MTRRHGITSSTYTNIIIDSGAVYKDWGVSGGNTLLGATRGGSSFEVKTEIRHMDVDGARGLVKLGERITNVEVVLVANFIEISSDLLNYALPGSDVTTTTAAASWDTITRALELATGDYFTNIAIVGEVAGTTNPVVCIVKNPLSNGELSMTFADKEETALPVTWNGHFTTSDLDTEPWEILYPKS